MSSILLQLAQAQDPPQVQVRLVEVVLEVEVRLVQVLLVAQGQVRLARQVVLLVVVVVVALAVLAVLAALVQAALVQAQIDLLWPRQHLTLPIHLQLHSTHLAHFLQP